MADAALIIVTGILILFFWGTPDLHDVIIDKIQNVEICE